MGTNNSPIRYWSERPRIDDYCYAYRHGIPVERLVELCNRVGADFWLCVPHLADDNYVSQLATILRNTLNSNLKIYIEYSNECWNFQFQQTIYCFNKGTELGLPGDDTQRTLRYYGMRSAQIHEIFRSVFGGTSRLVRVAGTQHGNSWGAEQVLDYTFDGSRKVYQVCDALAVAPYWGHDAHNRFTSGSSVSEVFSYLQTKCADAKQSTIANYNVATARGLDLIAYEGGQHITPSGNESLVALFSAVNRDWRMHDLYVTDMNNWRSAGGKLFMAFSSCCRMNQWGMWGVLEHQYQSHSEAPKYVAYDEWISANPKWW
jgi:hypothetical protein